MADSSPTERWLGRQAHREIESSTAKSENMSNLSVETKGDGGSTLGEKKTRCPRCREPEVFAR